MAKQAGGRPSKNEIHERREKVRELFLQGTSPTKISRILKSNYKTILSDIQYLQARYTSIIMNNSQLAKRQLARVEQLLDEISIIKVNYWELYQEILHKVEENKQKFKQWEKEVKAVRKELDAAEEAFDTDPTNKEARIRVRELRRRFDYIAREPKLPTYITARIDALKAILDRVDKESKLLSLFNPQALIEKNYVSVEVMKSVMEVFKGIIMELIPEEKRGYAFKRLRTIDIQSLSGDEVVEAEFTETRPKKAETKTSSAEDKPTEVKADDDEEIDI